MDVESAAQQQRTALRMAIPSKGRMAEDTLKLLSDCQLAVYKPNPRQYTAVISQARTRAARARSTRPEAGWPTACSAQLPHLEVWFQRASDVVRKLVYGDVDLGIVGHDMLSELAHGNSDLVVLHDALAFGKCHLGLGVPMQGRFAGVHTIEDLRRRVALAAPPPHRLGLAGQRRVHQALQPPPAAAAPLLPAIVSASASRMTHLHAVLARLAWAQDAGLDGAHAAARGDRLPQHCEAVLCGEGL